MWGNNKTDNKRLFERKSFALEKREYSKFWINRTRWRRRQQQQRSHINTKWLLYIDYQFEFICFFHLVYVPFLRLLLLIRIQMGFIKFVSSSWILNSTSVRYFETPKRFFFIIIHLHLNINCLWFLLSLRFAYRKMFISFLLSVDYFLCAFFSFKYRLPSLGVSHIAKKRYFVLYEAIEKQSKCPKSLCVQISSNTRVLIFDR